MNLQGRACRLCLITDSGSADLPFFWCTLRERRVALFERAVVEGDGISKGSVISDGVHGRVVTPLNVGIVPGLFDVLFAQGKRFDLLKVWGATIEQYLGCEIVVFDLGVMRGEPIYCGFEVAGRELKRIENKEERKKGLASAGRLRGDSVSFKIGAVVNSAIYGAALRVRRGDVTAIEIDVYHVLQDTALQKAIDAFTIVYDFLGVGFEIRLSELKLIDDRSNINTGDAILGKARYTVQGGIHAVL
jgi:hypothetical protein